MRIVRAALVYFAIVFGTSLLLARTAGRDAELLEAPLMLIATFFAARFIAKTLRPATATELLGVGFLAMGFLVIAELVLSFASRDPMSATVYYLLLALFAFMPVFVYRD